MSERMSQWIVGGQKEKSVGSGWLDVGERDCESGGRERKRNSNLKYNLKEIWRERKTQQHRV